MAPSSNPPDGPKIAVGTTLLERSYHLQFRGLVRIIQASNPGRSNSEILRELVQAALRSKQIRHAVFDKLTKETS